MGIHIINGNCFWDIIYPLGGMYAKCSKPLLVDKLLREVIPSNSFWGISYGKSL